MTPPIATLLCWNRGANAAAMAWHAAARSGRTLLLDELGDCCRLALQPPAGLRLTSLLPPDLAWLRHDGDPARLAEALRRALGDARGPRVLSVDALDAPPLLDAAIAAFRPDVIAATVALPSPSPACFARPTLDSTIRCAASWRPHVAAWLDAGARTGARPRRLVADEFVAFGGVAADPQAAVAMVRVMPQQRATLLLPGCGDGATRITLAFGQVLPFGGEPHGDLSVAADGREAAVRCHGHLAEVRVDGGARHVIGIVHRAPTDLDLVSVTVAPA